MVRGSVTGVCGCAGGEEGRGMGFAALQGLPKTSPYLSRCHRHHQSLKPNPTICRRPKILIFLSAPTL